MATRIDQVGYNDRQEIIEEISLRLADGMVDVELDRAHYDIAINKAIQKYRQLSSGSVEEAVIFIQTTAGVVEYTLPDEVIDVKRLYRRGIGTNSGGGTNFDPFDVAFNNMYMLQAGQIGGLAVFDAFAQYKETIGRVFGSEYNFTFNRNSKQLTILRNVNHAEDIAVGVNNFIPESVLIKDVYASDWLSNYALAQSKLMLGEARSKFTGGLPGPGGSIQLNGDALKNEALGELEQLISGIHNMEEGNSPLGFVIG
ncbi:hypothetical protein N8955_01510 [bacterium]|jgi:hypothetical protein|nr:hypothetical protein [Hellea sp.]MDA7807389.1 hypothetical protein [bacterium]MDA9047941.1 hypothetical protein [Hellea sp.]MDA9225149.1 hypothetical protein [bacterium]